MVKNPAAANCGSGEQGDAPTGAEGFFFGVTSG